MFEVPHESCSRELDLHYYILAYVSSHRAKPYMPVTCPFLDQPLGASTEHGEAPRWVIAVAVAVYSVLA